MPPNEAEVRVCVTRARSIYSTDTRLYAIRPTPIRVVTASEVFAAEAPRVLRTESRPLSSAARRTARACHHD
jgi:hypothetical protein